MMTAASGGVTAGRRHAPQRRPAAGPTGHGRDTWRVGDMRATWDALAGDPDAYVGDPRRGRCVEVGCGPGRMTGALAQRFERVIAVDVSPEMIARARRNVPDER